MFTILSVASNALYALDHGFDIDSGVIYIVQAILNAVGYYLWVVVKSAYQQIKVLKSQNVFSKARIPFTCPQWFEDGDIVASHFSYS